MLLRGVYRLLGQRVRSLSCDDLNARRLIESHPVTEMLLAILSICSEEELNESDESEEEEVVRPSEEEIQQRRQVIKNKILAVGRMQRVFQLLR